MRTVLAANYPTAKNPRAHTCVIFMILYQNLNRWQTCFDSVIGESAGVPDLDDGDLGDHQSGSILFSDFFLVH